MENQIHTLRFGDLTLREEEIIHFPRGIPGFEQLTRYVLIQQQEYHPFKFLQSVEDPAVSFPLLSPLLVREDYCMSLSDRQRQELSLENSIPPLIYCIVTVADDPNRTTANLFSPIVINPEQRKAAQLMLLDSGYPVEEPVMRAR